MSVKSVFLLLIFMSNGTYLIAIFGVRKHRIILKGLLSLPGMIKVCLVIFWDCSLSYIIIFKLLGCCIIWALEYVWLQGKRNYSICFRYLLLTIEGNHREVSFMQYSKSSRYVKAQKLNSGWLKDKKDCFTVPKSLDESVGLCPGAQCQEFVFVPKLSFPLRWLHS